ncbi:CocE/NonD family hydrolase [Microbacterium sp. NPDC055910]|uniref:CocE/NonD family hydrolase n=1 Tax=Microbacterium sp. NPDC055910 TaxID=3345659 RepID=UPI0035DD9908
MTEHLRIRRLTLTLACTTGLVLASLPAVAQANEAPAAATDTIVDSPLTGGITTAQNSRVPAGAAWTEHYFSSSDGSDVELHADVLRPVHLPLDQPTPIILSVGPYFGHIGQSGNDRHPHTGPSNRFTDLIEGGSLMERGYTVVYVDLRGYGGSTGCIDFAGPGEQADVVAAVDWVANQEWSTGKVGLYGKSYDAVTGLIGANLEPEGLEAVVAQEPLWNMYNYLYSNEVPRSNVTGTPRAYNSIASLQGMADDTDRYKANAAYEIAHPECLANNLADARESKLESEYWSARNLAEQAKGSTVPLFVTQGMTEANTKPEDFNEYLTNHEGVQRGWLGPWDHVRGGDRNSAGVLEMGREGWYDEVMRFYDEHLRGIEPEIVDPAFMIQDNFGTWRTQDTWPIVDRTTVIDLEPGSYVDDDGRTPAAPGAATFDMENAPSLLPKGDLVKAESSTFQARNRSAVPPRTTEDADGYYSWSRPLNDDTRISGTPTISFDATGSGNVLARLWDVAPDGTAVMFTEQMSRVSDGTVTFDFKDADWTLLEGHQLAVGIGTNYTRSWPRSGSGETITVSDPTLSLPLMSVENDQETHGAPAPFLTRYLSSYTSRLTGIEGTFSVNAGLDVTAETTPRALAGKVYLSVSATNRDSVPVDLTVSTAYGSKTFTNVAPGTSVAVSINTRLASVPAGEATVTVTGTVDGVSFTGTETAPFGGFPVGG